MPGQHGHGAHAGGEQTLRGHAGTELGSQGRHQGTQRDHEQIEGACHQFGGDEQQHGDAPEQGVAHEKLLAVGGASGKKYPCIRMGWRLWMTESIHMP
jgi:hypothetical protein